MKKFTTSQRLKQILSERNLKQVDIIELAKPYCEKYGKRLGRNDLSQYVNGKVIPSQDKYAILGLALNVSEAWLMGYDVPMERISFSEIETDDVCKTFNNIHPVHLKKFPMLGKIACGEPIWTDEDKDSYIMADMDIRADFCLTAQGDSMINARINDGDIVFIRKMPIVENGDIAAVIIGDEATLKRWYYDRDNNKLTLVAENPKFPPLVYINEELESIRCLGKAVYFMSAL